MKWLLTTLLDWAKASLLPDLLKWVWEWASKLKREKEQTKATEKLNDDVAKEKVRDEETRKNEEDWLNS